MRFVLRVAGSCNGNHSQYTSIHNSYLYTRSSVFVYTSTNKEKNETESNKVRQTKNVPPLPPPATTTTLQKSHIKTAEKSKNKINNKHHECFTVKMGSRC